MKQDRYKRYVQSGHELTKAIQQGASENRIKYLQDQETANRELWAKEEKEQSICRKTL